MRGVRLAAAALLLIASPASAQTRAISAGDKAQGAQANPQLLKEFGGAYAGPQAAFVERVGKRVAVQSGLSNGQGDFTVTLLNSPVENAFAIPGGYVYVTRQLVALMNSEAELASVLGHEVGHVAARHAKGRQRTAGIGSVLAGIVGTVAGNSAIGQLVGAGARSGAQLVTLKYGRDQEYQADALGVRYITAAGYDPFAAAEMLTQLNDETTLEARIEGRDADAVPGWASTHPNGVDRIRRARALAAATGRQPGPETQDTAFLRMLDGMAYDEDVAQGTIDGSTFRHRDLKLRFTAPQGYKIDNGTDAVTITGAGGQAQFDTAAPSADLAGFIAQRFAALGASDDAPIQTGQTNGLPYAWRTVRAAVSGRAVDATVVAYRFPAATNWLLLITPAGQGIGAFAPTVASMAPLSVSEAAAIRGKRVSIVAVQAGDTIDSLARRMAYPDHQRERFVTLNGVADDATLAPGKLVKLVVNG